MDYVVLKQLTLKSDLGWFKSIYDAHALPGHQKAITLNKKVMNSIWPSLLTRQDRYYAAKDAQKQAKALGPQGKAIIDAEKAKAKAVGTIPVQVELHGPSGKSTISDNRIIALQDKNWRLNGDFILDPPTDPGRFYPVMQEGDLALIGFEGTEWPTRAVVVLLSQTADAVLWSELTPNTSKGARSMVQVDQAALLTLADKHGLQPNHIIRRLAVTGPVPLLPPPVPAPAPPPVAAPALPPKQATGIALPLNLKSSQALTPDQLAEQLAAGVLTGKLGERMVDRYLTGQSTGNIPVHTWVSLKFAKHPYDFELLAASGAVQAVIDAKATSNPWPGEFYMSIGEIHWARLSQVPYYIYRLSEVGPSGGQLRISSDIRGFAKAALKALLPHLLSGTRITEIAVRSIESGINWSAPIQLPPLQP
jgi:hypothetical protein